MVFKKCSQVSISKRALKYLRRESLLPSQAPRQNPRFCRRQFCLRQNLKDLWAFSLLPPSASFARISSRVPGAKLERQRFSLRKMDFPCDKIAPRGDLLAFQTSNLSDVHAAGYDFSSRGFYLSRTLPGGSCGYKSFLYLSSLTNTSGCAIMVSA